MVASLGLRIRVRGRRRVRRHGPLIVASTHPGPTDISALEVALRRPLGIVLDEALLGLPLLGWLLRMRGAYAVRRGQLGGDGANAAAIADAAAAARAGRAIVIFPEGEGHHFGGGVARIAAAAQAPVLPVTIYPMGGDSARPRRLVVVGRALPPPADHPRARRALMVRLRRHHPSGDAMREALAMALDDPSLWRRPFTAVRLARRIARLDGDERRRFLRAARTLRRGCAAVGCPVGDVRRPPGIRELATYFAMLAPAVAGLLLCAPPLLSLRLFCARFGRDRRSARIGIGFALAGPYGLALAIAGLALLGAPGLLLPFVALGGLLCAGLARPLRRSVLRTPRVRRAGPRLRPLLAAFDLAVRGVPAGPSSREAAPAPPRRPSHRGLVSGA